MKRKGLILSMFTVVLCLALAAGSTYAIYSDNDNAQVLVKSATVDVELKAGKLDLYSRGTLQAEDVTEGSFANGGEASLSGNVITLTNLTPGDKIVIPVTITNKSNVSTKYRTVVRTLNDEGLFEGLTVTVDEVAYDGTEITSAWAVLAAASAADGDEVKTFEIVIEFPYLDGDQNAYQGKGCEIYYLVEAVQGNAG